MLQRLGLYRLTLPPGTIRFWIHAASVGEAQAAHKLLIALHARHPAATFIITTVNEQGRRVAQNISGKYATVALAPMDFPFCLFLAVRTLQPTAYICLETELWPNTLYFLHRSGAKLFITNGRLTARSLKRYQRFLPLIRFVLGFFEKIAVIGPEEAKRFLALGADANHLRITGNVKFDLSGEELPGSALQDLRNTLHIASDAKVFICGSTHSGEETLLLDVYRELKKHIPGLIWILAPRYIRILDEVETLLAREKIDFQRLQRCRQEGRKTEVILVDTIGELSLLYGLGTYTFCGGSLVAKGGHNIMEAAVWGHPVFYGPYMDDFQDARDLLEKAGAGLTVHSAEELVQKIVDLHKHPQDYASICRRTYVAATNNRGVAQKQAEIISLSL